MQLDTLYEPSVIVLTVYGVSTKRTFNECMYDVIAHGAIGKMHMPLKHFIRHFMKHSMKHYRKYY